MFILVLAAALLGQVDHIHLKGLQFQVESSQKVKISQKTVNKRVVFDIKPAKLGKKAPKALVSQNKNIGKIRIAQAGKDIVRVTAELKGKVKLSMKQVPAEKPKLLAKAAKGAKKLTLPPALLADQEQLSEADEDIINDVLDEQPAAVATDGDSKSLIIVLDPGHGGDDPGAIGKGGLREKDVTLAVSKRVKKMIERDIPRAKVYMTRDVDKTLTLPSRTDFANRMKADLFISIHVNASLNRKTQGVETYYLNIAHDRYALRLAARENAMSETETSNLEFILADLAMKSSVSDSVRLGNIVQDALCGNLRNQWDDIRNLGLKHAMFYVLMGAKMPAILVETSFISNKTDEKRLKSTDYQSALAEGIVKGIHRYSEDRVAIR
ncbi:MAG: N-acetylmuramoyl-L-alanine amidase [Myxococcota bacterium]